VVSIFTYRDERKLFAVAGAIIVAAVIALVQIASARSGRTSPIAIVVQSVAVFFESATATIAGGLRGGVDWVVSVPRLTGENAALRARVQALEGRNRGLQEQLSRVPEAVAAQTALARDPDGIAANVVAYDPEDLARTVTIDRGSRSGIARDDAVVTGDGAAGRVASVTPFASTVQLIVDATSKIPAVVQRGRWWAIATGVTQSDAVALEYISQDAKLRVGDAVVTGEGRSFHAGYALGRIAKIFRPEGALYQTAILTPAVNFGSLHGVIVLPRPIRVTTP
jgi:rod shape-determining protein MreC